MKKAIVCCLVLILFGSMVFGTAYASTDSFIEIQSDNAYLYSRTYDEQSNSFNYKQMFLLPITYYAKVLENPDSNDSDYVYISYNDISGWIAVSSIKDFKTETNVQNPYFTISDLSVISSVSLYKDYSTSSQVLVSLDANTQLTFISYYKNGTTTWYYVKSGDNVGYVQAVYTNHETVPFVQYNSEKDSSNPNKVPENKPAIEFFNNLNNNLLNWILSVLILIPTVVFVILIFKRKTSSSHQQTPPEHLNFSSQREDENDSQIYIKK